MVAERSARFCTVAHLIKSHGIKGEVVCTPAAGLPFVVVEGMDVVILPPQLEFNRFQTVKAVKSFGENFLISFEHLTSIDQAQSVCPGILLAKRSSLPQAFLEQHEAQSERDSVIGMTVTDLQRGVLGKIEEILISPAHDIWVVRGSNFEEVLIPVVDEMVLGLNMQGMIEVDLVEGLIS